jgi:protein transport protein SEC61 subunit gamma and related proteins
MENVTENGMWYKLKDFVKECVRVVKVTRKPTGEEYKTIVKVSGLGILLLGFIGFIITVAKQMLF